MHANRKRDPQDRTDTLFFEYCLTHTRHAYEAEAPLPAPIPRAAARQLEQAASILYRILERCAGAWPVPHFPQRETALQTDGSPFWARFDAFLAQDGGVFFAELNLDRPGGHREAMAAPSTGPLFRRRFLSALQQYAADTLGSRTPVRAAFLVDPAHREELHIAHFYAGLLDILGWPCTVVGPLNLQVSGDQALAFGEPINVLLRQFPTEFAHEVPAFQALARLHRRRKLVLINPPSAVVGQAKSAFAWLWHQVLSPGPSLLTPAEVQAVIHTVPYTAVMTTPVLPQDPHQPSSGAAPTPLILLERPQDWVLKPVLGRYSQGVTIGALSSPTQWGATVAAALAEPEYWIAQRYVPIQAQTLVRYAGDQPQALPGYVNWGLHFLAGRPAGWMARCSQSPVTDDSWFAPVSVVDHSVGADNLWNSCHRHSTPIG